MLRYMQCFVISLFLLSACSEKTNRGVDNMKLSNDSLSGYHGSEQEWSSFLSCWQKEILKKINGQGEYFSEEERLVHENKGANYPPASSSIIQRLEERLGISLPNSYKHFLLSSNGWIQIRMDSGDGVVFPAENVGWLKDKHPEIISDWYAGVERKRWVDDEKYYNYSYTQDPIYMRDEYLDSALMISSVVDSGLYLLNPMVISKDGEWEAWFFGWELPGALRFKSFAHLMRYAYYKAVKVPDYDAIYEEGLLEKTCAILLPVKKSE